MITAETRTGNYRFDPSTHKSLTMQDLVQNVQRSEALAVESTQRKSAPLIKERKSRRSVSPAQGDGARHGAISPFDDDDTQSLSEIIFGKMTWYDQCYHKISAHLRAEANIDATIEMAVAKAGDCAVDAIASMGVKENGDYQIFQQGAAIVAGLEKKRVMTCKTLIIFLDPSTIDNSARPAVKQDLQTLPQTSKLDPLQLCRSYRPL
jgi:hypothetical protein